MQIVLSDNRRSTETKADCVCTGKCHVKCVDGSNTWLIFKINVNKSNWIEQTLLNYIEQKWATPTGKEAINTFWLSPNKWHNVIEHNTLIRNWPASMSTLYFSITQSYFHQKFVFFCALFWKQSFIVNSLNPERFIWLDFFKFLDRSTCVPLNKMAFIRQGESGIALVQA